MCGGRYDGPPLVFRSKVDGWFRVLPCVGVLVLGAVLVLPAVQGDRAAFWLTPALLLPAALPLWLLRTTDYTITDTHLRIRCGPLRWNVPLADVRSVRPTRNPLSSPALSLDRLRIEYSRSLAVMVSPEDKEGFLRALRTRAPGLAGV
jgi:hypothetical protein